jgi:hypothetical protein
MICEKRVKPNQDCLYYFEKVIHYAKKVTDKDAANKCCRHHLNWLDRIIISGKNQRSGRKSEREDFIVS